MKKTFIYWGIQLFILTFFNLKIFGQAVSPYTLSPKWMIGFNAGMNFTTGSPPSFLAGNPASNPGQEATTTICDPSGNIVLYCNNSQIYNVSNSLFGTTVNGNNGHSSTQGAVSLPDPGNANQYYVFSGNDITGGSSSGINWYLIKNTAGTLSLVSGPNNLATGAQVGEALTVGADGTGGYWVVTHSQANEYWSWHVTSGGVSAVVKSTSGITAGGGTSAIRINKCQTKIGFAGQGGGVEVYSWDKTTGKVTGTPKSLTGYWNGYGCEFSPDGNLFYFTTLITAPTLYQFDLTTLAVTNLGTTGCGDWMGGLSLGPDDKIYSANGDGFCTKVGVVTKPNISGTGCTFQNAAYTLTSGSTHIGLANIAWLNPSLPSISKSVSSCTVNFSYVFKNYFLNNVDVTTSTILWDFGDGTTATGKKAPVHTYPSGTNTYTVNLQFRDSTDCQLWTATTSVSTSCPLPVTWLDIDAFETSEGVLVNWSTTSEKNNKYFAIQKSFDGQTFENIGTVNGKENSNQISYYNYLDATSPIGIVYYRVIQYDKNGESSISEVVSVGSEKNISVEVQPNPTAGQFQVQVITDAPASISVTDILGREIYSTILERSSNFDFGNSFTKGTYFLKVISNNKVVTKKLIKD